MSKLPPYLQKTVLERLKENNLRLVIEPNGRVEIEPAALDNSAKPVDKAPEVNFG